TIKPRIMDVHIGILPLLLVPLAFLRSPSRAVSLLKAFIVCYLLVWLFIRTEVRSMLSVLAALWCVYALALQRLEFPGRKMQLGFVALVIGSLIANFFMTIFSTYYLFDPLNLFFGRETKANYASRLAQYQKSYDFLNQRTDVGKVLLIGMHNPFYLR